MIQVHVLWLLVFVTASCSASDGSDGSEEQPPGAQKKAEEALSSSLETAPGSPAHPPELRQRLAEALAARGADYEPRTELLTTDGRPRFTNRLILEDSPYLIQHAHNPVNWFPWGEEAFELARQEERPIFLSIGYSTCHWCHVMERESFDNVEIARLMNEKFICIKVDREQRPDLDEVYMTAVQLTSGRGGWPMSSFLTPQGEPFFGATYFPPANFIQLLNRVDEAWHSQRQAVVDSAKRITAAVVEVTAARGEATEVGQQAIKKAVAETLSRHDAQLGGFGSAPKFPHEPELLLLLEHALRTQTGEALAAVETSLMAMAQGGIYDQVGGGFHRYSTDSRWLVPHFEKMLYNQAHLSRAYLEAHRLTAKPSYARVARQTLDYVLREMTAPEGGFYSATDADSEGVEGEFFTWTPTQIRQVLSPPLAQLAIDLYGVTEEGNFEGKNILNLPLSLEAYASRLEITMPDLMGQVNEIREKLRQVRAARISPLRDDKILTAWNGMMITSLTLGSEVLDDDRYLNGAIGAAEFLWRHNRREKKKLWRLHLDGSSSTPAVQEDYAYLAEGLLSLYDATGDSRWLGRAREVADGMVEQFWDRAGGGFFMSAEAADPNLITRPKSPGDGAIPSGNSVAVLALARLAVRTGELGYRDRAHRALAAFSSRIQRSAAAHSYMLLGAGELLHGEVGPRQYGASGNVAAQAHLQGRREDAARLEIDLRIRAGWHINAHQPLQEELIPTTLALGEGAPGFELGTVEYPEAERVQLSFQDEPLAVYQGDLKLTAAVQLAGRGLGTTPVLVARLKVQACNDEICLAPEELQLEVPASDLGRRH